LRFDKPFGRNTIYPPASVYFLITAVHSVQIGSAENVVDAYVF
jgi:hypothetical protein